MNINDLDYLNSTPSEQALIGGNTTLDTWYNWWQDYSSTSQSSATASFLAIAVGENTFTDVQATVIVTEDGAYSSVRSVAISQS